MNEQNYWARKYGRRSVLRTAAVGGAGLAGAALIGCGSDEDEPNGSGDPDGTATPANGNGDVSPTGQAAEGEPVRGGTLNVQVTNDHTGLDPSTSRGGNDHNWLYNMFENLVNIGTEAEITPGLAESWEVVDDTTVVFKIRQNSVFHDGSPVTGEDVRYTIERHKDPETGSYAGGQADAIREVEVTDDETLTFHLEGITAPIFTYLGDRLGMILPQAATEEAGASFNDNPVGSGPMRFENHVVDSSTTMSRFDDYWREGYPYLDGIEVEVVPNTSVQFANLRTGRTDWARIAAKDRAEARNSDEIDYHEWTALGYSQINTNVALFPNDDVRLRQAMTYALNRDAISEAVYFGEEGPANGPITPAIVWAYDDTFEPIQQDLQRSRELLSAAGYPDGIEFDMVIVADEERTPLAEMIKAQWAEAGINVNVVVRTGVQAGEEYRDQRFPMYLVGWSGRIDPDITIYENYHTQGSFNRVQYNDEYVPDDASRELDAKIEAARATYDQEERGEMYREIQRQLVEEAHGIFITHRRGAVGLSQRARGFRSFADDKFRYHEMWLEA